MIFKKYDVELLQLITCGAKQKYQRDVSVLFVKFLGENATIKRQFNELINSVTVDTPQIDDEQRYFIFDNPSTAKGIIKQWNATGLRYAAGFAECNSTDVQRILTSFGNERKTLMLPIESSPTAEYSIAFEAGFDAGNNGIEKTENPYDETDASKYNGWNDGWEEAKELNNIAEQALREFINDPNSWS